MPLIVHVLSCATKCLVTLRAWSGEMSKSRAMRSACASKIGAWPWGMTNESNSNRGYREDRHDGVTEVGVLAAIASAILIFAHRSQMSLCQGQHRPDRRGSPDIPDTFWHVSARILRPISGHVPHRQRRSKPADCPDFS
jgi:hypothetical protein